MLPNRLRSHSQQFIDKHRKLLLYLCVGALLFIIDFTVTVCSYYLFHFGPGVASGTGFCASFLVGFTLNKRLVFEHTYRNRFSLHTQVAMYFALALINLLVTASIVDYFVHHGIRIEFMKPIVVIAAACWNYVILGRFIFGHKPKEAVH